MTILISKAHCDIREIAKPDPSHYELLLDADPLKARVNEALSIGKLFALYHEEELVGVLILAPRPQEKGALEIMNIAVLEAYRRSGLATLLIEYAINEAIAEGYDSLLVGTGNSSFGAQALYQKMGFRIDGIELNYFVEQYPFKIIENGILCQDRINLRYLIKED